MNDFTAANVVRTGEALTISWEKPGNIGEVGVYWSEDADFKAEDGQLLAQVPEQEKSYRWHFEAMEKRPYFCLVAADGRTIKTAERILPLEGVVNFRDLGGYLTKDGRRTKWGKLLRSGAHDDLTDKDVVYLRNLGLKTVVDYRSAVEVGDRPDRKIDGISYHNIRPLEDAGATNILDFKMDTAEDAIKALSSVNRTFMRSKYALAAYRQLLLLTLSADNLPLVQHCTAGKDRVGAGSATLLLALGVPDETIIADYLLSNDYQVSADKLSMGHFGAGSIGDEKAAMFRVLASVHREYMEAMLDEMRVQFGDVQGYLHQGLGLTDQQLAQMQEMFLE